MAIAAASILCLKEDMSVVTGTISYRYKEDGKNRKPLLLGMPISWRYPPGLGPIQVLRLP